MRLGQGYGVTRYLRCSAVTQLSLQYLAKNCQQRARGGIQGQTYAQKGHSHTIYKTRDIPVIFSNDSQKLDFLYV